MESIRRDLRYALRGLRNRPGFAVAIVLTLALGIGGNTAIFSVVDQLLLRPLPYPQGDRVLTVYEAGFGFGTNRNVVSPANWLDWQRESRTLQSLAAWRTMPLTLTGVGEPVRLNAQLVSYEFFPLLGVRPLLGRTITADDDRPNAARVVVLSHRLWSGRFGSDPGVIGRLVQLNDLPAEVVGVMPSGFTFIYNDNDLWGAYRLDRSQPWRQTSGRFINVMARLADGTSIDAARDEMESIAARLAATYEFNRNTTVELVPLREELTGHVETAVLVLYAAVAVLLAIACFNVANLLVARAVARRREFAVRRSLGAGGTAIARQLLVESVLLAAAGGALGVAIATWSLDALVAFAPADLLRVPELVVDRRVLLYTLSVSALTGLAVGLVPVALMARESIVASIRSSGTSVTHAPRIRQALVVCQVAMTVVLLCGAALLVRTVVALEQADSGFDKRGLVTLQVGLPAARYDAERRTIFYREALDRVRALPGVESAGAANSMAVIGSPRGGSWFHRMGTPELPPTERGAALIRVVTPGFFRTLRIPVVRGREFTDADGASPLPGFVVNEAFVKLFLQDVDPLGTSMTVWMQADNPYMPIIGVVGDVSEGSIRGTVQPTIFYSHSRMAESEMTLFVRTGQPGPVSRRAVEVVRALDPNLAITQVRTVEDALAESIARERLSALVSGAFAIAGLALAALGLYALLAFVVTERTKEIGIRIALGAQLVRLTRSVVGGGLTLVATGAAIGIAGSLLLTRPVAALLFGVSPYDPASYAVVLGVVMGVGAWTAYVPARRAARIEPLTALRQE